MSGVISSIAWVPRGIAAEKPIKYEFDNEEMKRISELAKLQLEDAEEDYENEKAQYDLSLMETLDDDEEDDDEEEEEDEEDSNNEEEITESNDNKDEETIDMKNRDDEGNDAMDLDDNLDDKKEKIKEDNDDLAEYNLDDYDDEEKNKKSDKGIFSNIKSLSYYAPGDSDPYVSMDNYKKEVEADKEDLKILPSDNLLICAKTEDEISHLEVYVYEDSVDELNNGNLYIHHDFMLPSFPLCLEWINYSINSQLNPNNATEDLKSSSNFVAVGTFEPEIEIWKLDVVDSVYPDVILGDSVKETGKKKPTGKKKKKVISNDYHVDAVLSLSSNKLHPAFLASGSADKTVKIWDLNSFKSVRSFNSIHTDKICSIAWSQHENSSTALLTGSYDGSVCIVDARTSNEEKDVLKFSVDSDVETVKWDNKNENYFYVSTESGRVSLFDARNGNNKIKKSGKPVWTLQAHDEPVSTFSISPSHNGLLATASTDRTVKLWNISEGKSPSMIASRNMDVGKVFCASFAPDPEVSLRLAIAGSNGQVKIWDTATNKSVRKALNISGDIKQPDRIISEDRDDDDDDDDDDDIEDDV